MFWSRSFFLGKRLSNLSGSLPLGLNHILIVHDKKDERDGSKSEKGRVGIVVIGLHDKWCEHNSNRCCKPVGSSCKRNYFGRDNLWNVDPSDHPC